MTSNGVTILEPPYRDVVALIGRLPAPGSIAVIRIDGHHGLPPQVAELLERAPWTVPCIAIAPAAVSAAVLQSIWSLPVQPAVLMGLDALSRITPAAAAKAAASRPRPTAAQFVAYVVRRTNAVVLGQTLDQIWSPRDGRSGGNAERTVRYRLRRQGTYSRHDWIRIHCLLRAKIEAGAVTVEQLAQAVGTEPRTLRSWVARYLGMTMKAFRAMIGWEWILELALHRGGIHVESGATRPWSDEPTTRRRQPVPTSR
jgi:AraC-like DNA-binding protein